MIKGSLADKNHIIEPVEVALELFDPSRDAVIPRLVFESPVEGSHLCCNIDKRMLGINAIKFARIDRETAGDEMLLEGLITLFQGHDFEGAPLFLSPLSSLTRY